MLKPKPEDLFYHYCSVESFQAICERKTIRFSDINMMNDHMETRWGYRIFELAATEILNDKEALKRFPGVNKEFFDKVDKIIAPLQLYSLPTIASFSKEPDVLSQWRAYADDGRGFAIGFSGAVLSAMPVTLLEIQYDKRRQVDEMKAALLATYMENVDDGNCFGAKFRESCQLLAFWKLGFKNPAFMEEKEVRCLHALAVERKGNSIRLVDEGGRSRGKAVKGARVNYRVVDSAIVAHVDLPIPTLRGRPLIQEVWVGPRNVNGLGNIHFLMSGAGLKGFSIRYSGASYR
ncbi:MAG: DUF2971 domain-containing protein [Reyranella sp.]|nr:DUF2971 domain-containing protein [Reyranella sp.]